jgi:hypothetical protein
VCTYKNNPEAFKCLMCDVRKGTSTRKPRLNPDLVAVQVPRSISNSYPLPCYPRETKSTVSYKILTFLSIARETWVAVNFVEYRKQPTAGHLATSIYRQR